MVASLVFLTPEGALAGLAVAVPLLVLVLAARTRARARRVLRLAAPPRRAGLVAPVASAALVGLLAVAAAQPAVVDHTAMRVRTDAQAPAERYSDLVWHENISYCIRNVVLLQMRH